MEKIQEIRPKASRRAEHEHVSVVKPGDAEKEKASRFPSANCAGANMTKTVCEIHLKAP